MKKIETLKHIEVKLFIYPIGVHFIVCDDENRVYKFIGETHGESTYKLEEYRADKKLAATFVKKGWWPIIWLRKKPETPEEYGHLAHEVLHATFFITRYINVNLNNESDDFDEPFTYINEYLTREFWKSFEVN